MLCQRQLRLAKPRLMLCWPQRLQASYSNAPEQWVATAWRCLRCGCCRQSSQARWMLVVVFCCHEQPAVKQHATPCTMHPSACCWPPELCHS